MATKAARYGIVIEDREVYVAAGEDRLWVGDLDEILGLVGGPAWTISYTDRQKRRHPDLDTSDEGLTVDVVDVINGMELDGAFVESLERLPEDRTGDQRVPPRTGLFVGRLVGSLETGIE